MRISEERKREIIAAFQRSFKTDNHDEIVSIPLSELKQADEMHGPNDADASFRIAIRNRIIGLETTEQRKYDSKIRAWNLVTGIIIGLVIYRLGQLLFS